MSRLNLNTESLGALGGGTLMFAGFIVLAMVSACRATNGLGSHDSFRRAAKQVATSVTLNAIVYVVLGLGALSSFDSGPSNDVVRIFFFILLIGLVVAQILFLAAAVRNLLASLDQAR